MKIWFLLTLPLALSLSALEDKVLSVNGSSKVFIKATVAEIKIGVEVENKVAAKAEEELSKKTNQILQAFKTERVQHLHLSQFQVYPEYSNQSPPEIRSYRGKAEISLTTSIEDMGNIISFGLEKGANHINDLTLKASDQALDEGKNLALKKATEQALRSAETVLETLHLELKEVVDIQILSSNHFPTPYPMATTYAKSAPVQVEGEQEVQAEVALKLSFKSR